jgi:hypothetical protein
MLAASGDRPDKINTGKVTLLLAVELPLPYMPMLSDRHYLGGLPDI